MQPKLLPYTSDGVTPAALLCRPTGSELTLPIQSRNNQPWMKAQLPSRYTFTEYSSEWPAEFDREAISLRSLLDTNVVVIHHIGSTSVPALAAKPIIDVLP